MNNKNTLAEESLSSYLTKLVDRAPGIQAAAITDKDGAIILKVVGRGISEEEAHNFFASTFSVALEQASKLKMGKARSILSFYEERLVYHVDHSPLILSFVGLPNANVGILQSFMEDVKHALNPLRESLLLSMEE
eukprot:TRINITY_DN5791_c0_g1_i1.p1 TRINITY_DN5791_c0_g1~~TRINITY_DN5791_c0_g1_i1.p1  ORF type:complete len:135 (-),score=47.32 TRINITY_DN5791_c0_g1_i1:42-446(-)